MSNETTQLEPELEAIAATLDGLTIAKAAKLVKALEARWGVSAAAPVAVAGPAQGGGAAAAVAEEKTTFDVVLKTSGMQKIQVIKVVRAVTLGHYVHPAATVEDMYRPDRYARTAAGTLSVGTKE